MRRSAWWRIGLLVLLEGAALVLLLVLVAGQIPRVAPPPGPVTPTIPRDVLRDCPGVVPGCR